MSTDIVFHCSYCNLALNIMLSIGSRWYCPKKCGRHYKNKGTLTRHLQEECGVVPQYLCTVCNKRFKRKDILKYHRATSHRIL